MRNRHTEPEHREKHVWPRVCDKTQRRRFHLEEAKLGDVGVDER